MMKKGIKIVQTVAELYKASVNKQPSLSNIFKNVEQQSLNKHKRGSNSNVDGFLDIYEKYLEQVDLIEGLSKHTMEKHLGQLRHLLDIRRRDGKTKSKLNQVHKSHKANDKKMDAAKLKMLQLELVLIERWLYIDNELSPQTPVGKGEEHNITIEKHQPEFKEIPEAAGLDHKAIKLQSVAKQLPYSSRILISDELSEKYASFVNQIKQVFMRNGYKGFMPSNAWLSIEPLPTIFSGLYHRGTFTLQEQVPNLYYHPSVFPSIFNELTNRKFQSQQLPIKMVIPNVNHQKFTYKMIPYFDSSIDVVDIIEPSQKEEVVNRLVSISKEILGHFKLNKSYEIVDVASGLLQPMESRRVQVNVVTKQAKYDQIFQISDTSDYLPARLNISYGDQKRLSPSVILSQFTSLNQLFDLYLESNQK